MAEIKDVYSLEFNSSQFQTEINSAIQSIDELNNAMAEGVDVADDLESAQANLVNVLNTEAKGVEQLNQKRDTLVKTQKAVNAESKAGVAVGKQLDATNKQIAVSTGQAANGQRGFAGSLLQGARNINGLRRAGMMLGNVFRLLGGLNPFGLLLTALPTVIDYIFGATTAQKAFNEATESAVQGYAKEKVALDELFGSLNDANIKGEERSAIIKQVNDQYGDYLPNLLTEANTAEEIAAAYDLINNALIRKAVTQAKTNALEAVTGKLIQDRIAGLERQKKAQKDLDDAGVAILMRNKDGEEMFSRPTNDDQARAINNFKAAKKNLQNIDKAYKEEVKKINESAKDLEKSLGLTQVPTTPKPPKPPRTPTAITQANRNATDEKAKLLQEELTNLENALKIEINKTEEGTEARARAELKYIDVIEQFRIQNQKGFGDTEAEITLMMQDNVDKRKKINLDYFNSLDEKEKERIEKLKVQIEETEALLNLQIQDTQEGSQQRIDAEMQYYDVLKDLYTRYAKDLGMTEKQIDEFVKQGLKKRFGLYEDYYNKQSTNQQNNLERELNNQLTALEQERNALLQAATGNAEEQEKINKNFDKRRLELEKDTNKKILDAKITLLNQLRALAVSTGDANLLADIDKQISEIELKLVELGKLTEDGIEPPDPKKLIEQIGQVITGVSDSVFSVLNAQVQAYISGLDKAIDKSKSALDEIRANSEDFNARQLEIEKERLEKLEAERARAVEREKTLAQVQIAINASIAISKALIEGGGFASAVTVGLTIASLIAGLAQARAAAGNAFFHGVEYLERGNNKAGRDTIPAMLNEGERVITTDTNNKYWDVLSAVHNNRIPADVLNTFSKAYQQGGIKNALGAFGDNVSLSNELGQKSIFVNVAQTYGGLENRLERIENVLTELPKYMPRTTVSANANGIFKIVEQRQARKNFSKNWSK
jgi:predicted nucleic acid-binding protein